MRTLARYPHSEMGYAALAAKQRFGERYTESNPVGVAPAGVITDNMWLNSGDISGFSSWSALADAVVQAVRASAADAK